MRTTVLIAAALMMSVASAFSGGTGEGATQTSEAGASAQGQALGLYPEYFQFATLAEFEQVTGNTITQFGEAPMLAEMVARGELPPVEQRLPEQPLVIVRNAIGKYGGTLRTAHDGTATDVILTVNKFMEQMPYTFDPDYDRVGPNILQESELIGDGDQFIWHLRKGMRWSDGEPMTADDYMFWYEAVATNKDLQPNGVREFKLNGIMGVMEKVDDYQLRITFPAKFGYFPEQIAIFRPGPFLPKHYMTQFHPEYVSEEQLSATLKEEGFTDWKSMWTSKRTHWAVENPDMPHIRPWIMETDGRAQVNTMIRNPYFWKVDTAGNQLPYIDGVESILVGDQEAKKLQVISGDADYIYGEMLGKTAETFALLKENEQRGGYTLISTRGTLNNQGTVNVNMAHDDLILRELFLEKDFRIALSLGLDRDEINQVIHRGAYIPSQVTPNTAFGNDDAFKQHIRYDPDAANRLLDGLDLAWNSDQTVRLRPDGEPLQLVMFVYTARGPWMVEMAEMYKQYWSDLGVDVLLKPFGEGVWNKIFVESDWHLAMSQAFGGMKGYPAISRGEIVPIHARFGVTPRWAQWIVTDGAEGVEPPADVKRLAEIPNLFMQEADPAKRAQIEEEIFRIHLDNMWIIGGMNANPDLNFSPFSNRIRNRVGTVWATYHHVASAWYFDE